ncbi:MAG: DUF3825 domain-containing protein [Bacteroidales bacterium]|nr:DUF3825 domain-containing protein [Bacteroidales bacterium]
MKEGIVKWYDTTRKFGFITPSDSANGTDVYFHISNVKDELLVLLENNKGKNEQVIFEEKPSSKLSGQLEGFNVSLDSEKRKVGYIHKKGEECDNESYYITDYYSGKEYYLHHKNIRKTTTDKFVSFEEEDPVVFSPEEQEKGLIAKDVVLVDNRPFIRGFAAFQDYDSAILQLIQPNLCEDENWDYIQKPTGGFPILKSYLNKTCERVVNQGKIKVGKSSDGTEYLFFNTGLVNVFQDEIFAYFVKNKRYSDNQPWGIRIPEWWFLEFNTDQSYYRKFFNESPEIATYFEETEVQKLIFDTTLTIRPNWEHLNKRRSRVDSEEIQKMSEQEFRDAIEDSITMARKRIKRNYKTAIPHFYNNDIQFLVPLCERKDRGKALAAMVIQKSEQIYEVTTILTLDQAYNNARLLAKPDREWLNP